MKRTNGKYLANQIFLGNGEHSEAECRRLHKDLDEAISTLCGLQQPMHWDHEPSRDEKAKNKWETMREEAKLEWLATSVYQRLTGKQVMILAAGAPARLIESLVPSTGRDGSLSQALEAFIKKSTSSKRTATKALQAAGIIDKNGRLSAQYRHRSP